MSVLVVVMRQTDEGKCQMEWANHLFHLTQAEAMAQSKILTKSLDIGVNNRTW